MFSKAVPLDHTSADHGHADQAQKSRFWVLTLGCIGVVYGDIGTSPLYAFREAALQASAGGALDKAAVFGVLSLILWALIVIVTLKYVLFLLRADNRGEGGILSLMALAQRATTKKQAGFLFLLGMIGAALFYGDAAITPAISVLSAVEGLKLVTPAFDHAVLPISIAILVGLFVVQKNGTGSIAMLFGPITAVWFLVIGLAGLVWIVKSPDILLSFSPTYAAAFIIGHGKLSLVVLGAVFLAVTGAEALYADLGHFGMKPIQTAWLYLVFPCLALNYLGQGALVLDDPKTLENPFFLMVPDWALLPLVILATMATIIASQAVITGAYSLTRQAIQLGFFPRMEIRHTSADTEGQIYIPKVNNLLLLGVLFLCALFKTSGALAAAYGIAVTGTMVVTSILVLFVIWRVWKKSFALACCAVVPFLLIESVFFGANSLKIFEGGIVPLLFAALVILIMRIWVNGTRYLFGNARKQSVSLSDLLEQLDRHPPARVAGTAVFLTSDPSAAPVAMLQNLKYNKVLHEKNIVLTVITTEMPKVADAHRMTVEHLSSSITLVIVSYGFMESPDIPRALLLANKHGLNIAIDEVFYFLGRRTIVAEAHRGLPDWQDPIYISMARSAATATDFYRLPPSQVVEMGTQMAV